MPDLSWALQRKLLRAKGVGFNAEISRWFKDEDTPTRKALRDSLLIQAKESRTSAMFKVQYFRDFVQKVHNKPSIIGLSKEQFDIGIDVTYKPIVTLYFQQDKAAVPLGFAPVTAEISFRLMNETSETLTQGNLKTLARAIKSEFATGQGYTFRKGKYITHYLDKEHGYSLQLYVINETEGVEIIKKVLSVRNHTYDDDKVRVTEPKRNSLNTPGNLTVAGKSYRKSRWRPTATVRFCWASIIFYPNPDPIYLVDRTFSRSSPVELVS